MKIHVCHFFRAYPRYSLYHIGNRMFQKLFDVKSMNHGPWYQYGNSKKQAWNQEMMCICRFHFEVINFVHDNSPRCSDMISIWSLIVTKYLYLLYKYCFEFIIFGSLNFVEVIKLELLKNSLKRMQPAHRQLSIDLVVLS